MTILYNLEVTAKEPLVANLAPQETDERCTAARLDDDELLAWVAAQLVARAT